MRYTEAEQAFYEDVREKKKTASGVHGKTGKKGYVGKMLFPSDIMSRKDKYNHRKAGKIVSSNLYQEILTIDEFNKLEDAEKRNMMIYWRNEYKNAEIRTKMKIGNAYYYRIVDELKLPKAPRGPIKNKSRVGKTKVVVEEKDFSAKFEEQFKQGFEAGLKQAAEEAAEIAALQAPVKAEPIQEIMVDGIHLVFTGKFSPAHIQNQLLKFASMLDGEEDEFYVELKLLQKSKA